MYSKGTKVRILDNANFHPTVQVDDIAEVLEEYEDRGHGELHYHIYFPQYNLKQYAYPNQITDILVPHLAQAQPVKTFNIGQYVDAMVDLSVTIPKTTAGTVQKISIGLTPIYTVDFLLDDGTYETHKCHTSELAEHKGPFLNLKVGDFVVIAQAGVTDAWWDSSVYVGDIAEVTEVVYDSNGEVSGYNLNRSTWGDSQWIELSYVDNYLIKLSKETIQEEEEFNFFSLVEQSVSKSRK